MLHCAASPTRLGLLPIIIASSSFDAAAHGARHVPLTSSNSFINIIGNCPVHCESIHADWRQHARSDTVHHHWISLPEVTQSHKSESAEYRYVAVVNYRCPAGSISSWTLRFKLFFLKVRIQYHSMHKLIELRFVLNYSAPPQNVEAL